MRYVNARVIDNTDELIEKSKSGCKSGDESRENNVQTS